MEKHIAIYAEALQALVLLAGVVWAIWRFRIELPTKPRIELDVDVEFLGPQLGQHLASIAIQVHNRGAVNHQIEQLEIKIRGLKGDAPLEVLPGLAQRVNFPHKIVEANNIMGKYKYYFIRAGVQQRIHYHTAIPEGVRYILVWAAFHYSRAGDKHTVERIFEVKTNAASSTSTPVRTAI